MTWFNNLPIFKKVGVIFIISVIIFAVNLAISLVSINKNRETLGFMEEKIYQRVELANQNLMLVQRLEEVYTQAVSFADEDLLEQAGGLHENLAANLTLLQSSDIKETDTLRQMQSQLANYNQITSGLAKSMLDGSADMANIGAISQKKSAVYEALLGHVQQYKQAKVLEFKNTIKEAADRSQNSLWLTMVVGVVLLLFMAIVTMSIARAISASAKGVAHSLGELADGKGDLRHQLPASSRDELGQVSSNFNRFLGLLADSIQRVVNVTSPLLKNAHDLKDKMETATGATQRQSRDAQTVQASMEEMRLSVIDISHNASQAADAAQIAEREAMDGMAVVQRTMDISLELNREIEHAANAINELAKDTESVSSILNVITSIAEQTNLLALNAAIEAARAGEQGRGFAVVADEVRALASKTADATKEIREVLSRLKGAAESSVSTMTVAMSKSSENEEHAQKTGLALKTIQEQIVSINAMNTHIARSTDEQSQVASRVVDNVVDMNASFEQTLNILDQVHQVSSELSEFAEELQSATSQFKL
ncbi:methyl-accepting chemotaxis protein [Shewanella sp. FJAT-52076]|uniref:methyl-accepting chemotaxis protein n=1 Tax=Shewanella sp. FJAT-52076 TaxID=2864202 RepID=UPI001C65CEF3|nr:HAMP domain-containing methyl-accepting chemotaxis protein [Shewanella sp. FJAT-52076]QYJ76001.1 HAMP domain-containing protein [Shewanella sp. FJAT-52076]